MSFDLAFWYTSDAIDATRAREIYEGLMEEEEGLVAENSAIDAFFDDVVSAYPDLTAESMHDSPWASEIYRGPACIVVAISWSRHVELSKFLRELAIVHGLVCYDPQAGTVSSPL